MLEKYYLSVNEFPLFNWFRCHEEQYKYCRRDASIGTEKEDAEAWGFIYDDFIKKIGLGEDFNIYLDNLKIRAEYCLEFLESLNNGKRNLFLINKIRMITIKIDKFESKLVQGENSEVKMLNAVGKFLGFRVPQKEMTVIEYYSAKEDFIKSLKQQ